MTDLDPDAEFVLAQRRYLLTTTLPAALILLASVVWSLTLLSDVPDPMATHFDASGSADGFSSRTVGLMIVPGVTAVILALFTALGRAGLSSGPAARFNAAGTGFTVTLLSAIHVQMFTVQRGLADPADASLPWTSDLLSFAAAAAVAVVLAALTRPVPDPAPPLTGTVPDLSVQQGVRVAWFRSEIMNTWAQAGTYALVVVLVVVGRLDGESARASLGYLTVVLLLVLSASSWRLRVDAEGFRYRSILGLPRTSVPYEEIAFAELVTVHPGEWGGWGWRFNGTGTGLVTAHGPGIRITRTNRKVIEMTCGDAERGLAALKYYGVHVLDPAVVEERITE